MADAGMISQDNRRLLAQACGTYLLAVRLGRVTEVKAEVFTRPGRYQKIADNLYAKEVVWGNGERRRRYILCCNPLETKRQRWQELANSHPERSFSGIRFLSPPFLKGDLGGFSVTC